MCTYRGEAALLMGVIRNFWRCLRIGRRLEFIGVKDEKWNDVLPDERDVVMVS